LTEKQRSALFLLYPFRAAINLGKPIIREYLKALKKHANLQPPSYGYLKEVLGLAESYGFVQRVQQFPQTELLQINPYFSMFLKSQSKTAFPAGEMRSIEIAFLHYYDWLGHQLFAMYEGSSPEERQEDIEFLALEYENMRAAILLHLKHATYDFNGVLTAVNVFLDAAHRHLERWELANFIKTELESLPENERNEFVEFQLVDALDSMGAAMVSLRRFEEASVCFVRALDYYHAFGLDKEYPAAARTLYQSLAAVAAYQAKWEDSNAYYSKMLEIAERFGDMDGISSYYLNTGKNFLELEDYETAAAHFEKAAKLHQVLDKIAWVGVSYNYLGILHVSKREYDIAEAWLQKALSIFQRLDDKRRMGEVYNEYSLLYAGKKDFDQSLSYAKKAISLLTDTGKQDAIGMAFLNFCTASVGMMKFEEAVDYLRKAFWVFHQIKDTDKIKTALAIAQQISMRTDSAVYDELRAFASGSIE